MASPGTALLPHR
jgi:hypothetical protein